MPQQIVDTPLVSVIVPCYNSAPYLAEALDSVLAQTYVNWECIIADDGSADNSKQIAVTYTQKDKRFKYIHQENKGVSATRNNAIGQSTGKYILPLDADDKIAPAYLAEAIKVFENEPNTKLVYCLAALFGKKRGKWNLPPYSYKNLLIENLIFCSAVFKKADFDKTSGYDIKMVEGFEDWDFWLSFLTETDRVFQIPRVLFYYRLKDTSRNTDLDEAKQRQLRTAIYKKHESIYTKYFSQPDMLFEYYKENKKYEGINSSMTYRLGVILLWPYRFIRNILK